MFYVIYFLFIFLVFKHFKNRQYLNKIKNYIGRQSTGSVPLYPPGGQLPSPRYPGLRIFGVLPSMYFSPCLWTEILSVFPGLWKSLSIQSFRDRLYAHALLSAEVSGRRVDAEAWRQDTGEGVD